MAINYFKRKANEAVRLAWAPVDIASLAAFRILFGLLMAAAMIRFISKGWVRQFYVEPTFHFNYPGFEWVQPWPDFWMHAHFILLAALAVGVALGFFYRICATLFFLGFTYVELIDQTAYLNHYYLISLLSGLMIFLPAHRAWSMDAGRNPVLQANRVPGWTLNLLRFQVGVVYVFAGLAKLNADWLLRAQPLRLWLPARSDMTLIGPWLNEVWVAYAASWCGAIFDTTIVFFLLNKRTRQWAYACVVLFHVGTWMLFNIGMFPWIMILAATLFFSPGWPRPWAARLGGILYSMKLLRSPRSTPANGAVMEAPHDTPSTSIRPRTGKDDLIIGLVTSYMLLQLALPLRSFFYPDSAWGGSGFNFAWRVMLVEKSGYAEFRAFDPTTGRRWKVATRDYLTRRQEVMMAQDPHLIRDLARHIAADMSARGYPTVQIQVDSFATLNGRPSQRLIRPDVDLVGAKPAFVPLTL